jgi:CRISPR/Cas system-associated protein Cas5 (RAMP superfamily)
MEEIKEEIQMQETLIAVEEQTQEIPAPIDPQQERIELLREERRKRPREQQYAQPIENKQQQQPEDELHIGDDDLAEGKHLKRYEKKIRMLEEKLKTYEHTTMASTAEARLRYSFPDFDKVVNHENIELLRDLEPDIAASINANPDLYTKASSAYKLIKKLGIYRDDIYKQDKELAVANSHKPRPLASVSPQQGESPLQRANAFANGLTPELREQLLKEMRDVRRKN